MTVNKTANCFQWLVSKIFASNSITVNNSITEMSSTFFTEICHPHGPAIRPGAHLS